DVRGHNMAKAGIESAMWDLFAKEKNISLSEMLGGQRDMVEVGVSIGIQNSIPELIERITQYLDEGYKRIKIKIAPSNDIKLIEAVRRDFPKIMLQVDANSAYTIDDLEIFRNMDKHDLLLIEQPFGEDDFSDHAKLQKEIETPICLDEGIKNFEDVRTSHEFGSCKIINIKPGRVGGFSEAVKIHDYCAAKNIPVWHGGMLESGIGRAGNIALASLPNFTLPGDISASDRYFNLDIVDPPFTLNSDGTIKVPTAPGIGVDVQIDRLDRLMVQKAEYKS
ncbi:o-succinylbenzoate synthase, partial [Bacteroidota bacterium]